MPEMGALFLATQAMAAPGELLNLSLNASAVLPEAAVLLAMIATLLVDLAGEKVAARWVPLICYVGLGSALVLLALQWNAPLEPSFLGAFLADNL
ncbi:NAD(P)H-quinone oxidoreductase subunit 2, partial [Synechococcus sp. AH-601-J22]|nr:NAD(P)H-quinone oxidoreductase subunit 2 [Synechococcus sp. AH-601-J22]